MGVPDLSFQKPVLPVLPALVAPAMDFSFPKIGFLDCGSDISKCIPSLNVKCPKFDGLLETSKAVKFCGCTCDSCSGEACGSLKDMCRVISQETTCKKLNKKFRGKATFVGCRGNAVNLPSPSMEKEFKEEAETLAEEKRQILLEEEGDSKIAKLTGVPRGRKKGKKEEGETGKKEEKGKKEKKGKRRKQ